MKREWQVHRAVAECTDGQRRWDYAYQFLLRWMMEQTVGHNPQNYPVRRMMMKIAIYARVSTNRQMQSQSIEQQIERLQAAVAEHPEWELAMEHIYRDDGYTGAKLNRPGLDRLRDAAGMAAFEMVLVTAPDRLARKYVHQVLLIEEMHNLGCEIHFLERPMKDDDPHDQLLLQIRGAVAEYERNLIAERMRRGRLAKLRAGTLLPWTRAPYGYIVDPERPRDPSRVRIDPSKPILCGKSLPGILTRKLLFRCTNEEVTREQLLSDPPDRPAASRRRPAEQLWACLVAAREVHCTSGTQQRAFHHGPGAAGGVCQPAG